MHSNETDRRIDELTQRVTHLEEAIIGLRWKALCKRLDAGRANGKRVAGYLVRISEALGRAEEHMGKPLEDIWGQTEGDVEELEGALRQLKWALLLMRL
jgi:hypothetical protein